MNRQNFQEMMGLNRIMQFFPLIIYILFYRYLVELKSGKCNNLLESDILSNDYKVVKNITFFLIILYSVIVLVGPQFILDALNNNGLINIMALVKALVTIVVLYYFYSLSRLIRILKRKCSENKLMDNVIIVYSNIMMFFIILVVLISLFTMNMVIADEIKDLL